MALLQDPIKSLDQARWYLENIELERFPGAFDLAAGNLCRQTLEQALFILCFYSGVPRQKYVRSDRTLKTAGTLVKQLDTVEPSTGKSYWDVARGRCAHVAALAKRERNWKRWARVLNEPSHFSLQFRKVRGDSHTLFVKFAGNVFDARHQSLIIAAVNVLFSRGKMWVVLDGKDARPFVYRRQVVRMKHFTHDDSGRLSLSTPEMPIKIISNDEVPAGPWPHALVFPRTCVDVGLGARLVTPKGDPIDLSSFKATIESFATTSAQRAALQRRFKQLGYELQFKGSESDGVNT
jgi:hypothetical protein